MPYSLKRESQCDLNKSTNVILNERSHEGDMMGNKMQDTQSPLQFRKSGKKNFTIRGNIGMKWILVKS